MKFTESLSLVIPVYNERNNVETAVNHCTKILQKEFEDFEIILVNDGSTDGTAEVMEALAKKNECIHFLNNIINLNQGISIQRGFSVAKKNFVMHNGIDFPLAIEHIPSLIEKMIECDVLVIERKFSSGYSILRHITSIGNRFLRRLLFPILSKEIRDMNFTQIYRRTTLKKIMPLAKSPAFTTPEMILKAKLCGLRVKSILADYHPRETGKGAFGKPHDILWTIYDMFRFRVKSLKNLY